eukprot:Pgem_evm1s16217
MQIHRNQPTEEQNLYRKIEQKEQPPPQYNQVQPAIQSEYAPTLLKTPTFPIHVAHPALTPLFPDYCFEEEVSIELKTNMFKSGKATIFQQNGSALFALDRSMGKGKLFDLNDNLLGYVTTKGMDCAKIKNSQGVVLSKLKQSYVSLRDNATVFTASGEKVMKIKGSFRKDTFVFPYLKDSKYEDKSLALASFKAGIVSDSFTVTINPGVDVLWVLLMIMAMQSLDDGD